MPFRLSYAVVVTIALAVSACSTTSDVAEGYDDAGAVVESYIEAYNAGDFEDVMSHFVVDSSITGHPTDFDPVATDIYSIRSLHKEDLRPGQQYVISNLDVEGDTVTWNSVWGEDGCVQGQSAVVEDGKILSWVWGEFVDCSILD